MKRGGRAGRKRRVRGARRLVAKAAELMVDVPLDAAMSTTSGRGGKRRSEGNPLVVLRVPHEPWAEFVARAGGRRHALARIRELITADNNGGVK